MTRSSKVQAAGILLGIGLGGFLDGIVLHQIVQWHNMGSAVLPPTTMPAMKQNMAWDGLFHAATWLVRFTGVWLLVGQARRSAPPTNRVFAGQLLLGWGTFNLVEGLVDHHLLGIHHVRDLPVYDWAFLVLGGVGFAALGWLLARRAGWLTRPPPAPRRSPVRLVRRRLGLRRPAMPNAEFHQHGARRSYLKIGPRAASSPTTTPNWACSTYRPGIPG